MKHPKKKVEFWLNADDKTVLLTLCKRAGYTLAEIMRRAAEEKIEELRKKVGDK